MSRVAVTGLGAITPVGQDINSYWSAIIHGRSGITRITSFDPSPFSSQIAGEVKNFDPTRYLLPKEVKRTDRYTHFAVAASAEALQDAGLLSDNPGINRERVGVVWGSGIGGIATFAEQHTVLIEKGPKRVSPFFISMMISNTAAGYLAMRHGFMGPNYGVVSACASAGHAIADAFCLIKGGRCEVVLTGGSEASIIPMSLAGFCANRSLSTGWNDEPERASRPWDKDRDGFVMSEGGGALVLEELEHAKRRGARIHAELIGVGMSSDAYHFTAPPPDGDGAYFSMRRALKSAGVAPDDVEYVNAHGTATTAGDIAESNAIKRLFSNSVKKLRVSSVKSMVGHLLGAAGAVEAIATIMSLKEGIIPPTINLEQVDPRCEGLDYVPNRALEQKVKLAISNSFGFGGHNVTLVFRRFED